MNLLLSRSVMVATAAVMIVAAKSREARAQDAGDEAAAEVRLEALTAEMQADEAALDAILDLPASTSEQIAAAKAARDERARARSAGVLKLEEAHRGTGLGARALMWIFTRGTLEDARPALEILTDNYVLTPFARQFAGVAATYDLWEAESFLKHLANTNPDLETRSLAHYCLGYNHELVARRGASGAEAAELRKEAAAQYEKAIAALTKGGLADHETALKAEGALNELRNLQIGQTVPEIEGTEIGGKGMKLSDFRGKVVALVFWATWCGPCMAMIPHERELVARMKGRPFALVGVNGDTDLGKLKDAITREKITWPSFFDGKGEKGRIPQLWNINANGWPMTYVIDAKGVIRFKNVRGEAMDKAVDQLVEEAEGAAGKRK